MKRNRRILAIVALPLLGACADTTAGPEPRVLTPSVATSAVKFWETNAAANWNEIATSLAARRTVSAGRLYAYLSLAQLRAAEDAAAIVPHPPVGPAIGGASAEVLRAFFPADVAEIEGDLDAQEGGRRWPGDKHENFVAGEAFGRAAAARVLAWAATDGVGLTNPGTPPLTPGSWLWNGGPIARGNLGARPFFLSSGDELRSAPPPAFGSADFLAALAEVRQISDTRTPAQLAVAQYWNVNQSPASSAAMNDLAVALVRSHRRSESESARIFFLMNAASFDALIGCFDAKYHYWFLRPSQADAAITLPIGLPPHPSYPSAHSCSSGAWTHTLALAFPNERQRLEQLAEEAGLSRLYAGIHFRFDALAGLALGRAAAERAAAANLDLVAVK